jgi:hypothetical protein
MPRIGAPTTPPQPKEGIGRETSKWAAPACYRTRINSSFSLSRPRVSLGKWERVDVSSRLAISRKYSARWKSLSDGSSKAPPIP